MTHLDRLTVGDAAARVVVLVSRPGHPPVTGRLVRVGTTTTRTPEQHPDRPYTRRGTRGRRVRAELPSGATITVHPDHVHPIDTEEPTP